jgi:hypothetical protein
MRSLSFSLVVCTFVAASSLLPARSAKGIILADQWWRNKSAPTGSFANSGWQWQGNWGAFSGTPIGKNYFITASHVGGAVGQSLVLKGVSYQTTAMYDDPSSDLRIWKTSKSFSSWAPIYTLGGEANKTAVLFGRGTQRGNGVYVGSSLKGWTWGPQDQVRSWGRNKIKGFTNGGAGLGDMLTFSFDRSGSGDHLTYEGVTSAGDSSGAVFVNSYGTWKLAGINYSIEGPFSTSSAGSKFLGAIYDKGGLYYNGAKITDTWSDLPGSMYATRIASHSSWINNVLAGRVAAGAAVPSTLVPEPIGAGLLAAIGMAWSLKRRRR